MVYLHTFAIPLDESLSLPTRIYVHAFKKYINTLQKLQSWSIINLFLKTQLFDRSCCL